MKSAWRKYIGESAPRYTSYPSASHFDASVTVGDVNKKLDDIDLYDLFSLYVHVPFCRQLCWYCGCNMRVENYYGRAREYVDALTQEIAQYGQRLNGRGKPSAVHFGGGTPNYLLVTDLNDILSAIEREIGLTDGAQLSIELDPRILREDDIDQIVSLGFGRFSLGIQDFDPLVQNAINRLQSFELIEACVSDIRAAGVQDLSFDILYGLPRQTVKSFAQTLEKVICLAPDRVSVFGYAHLPHVISRQKMIDPANLPDNGLRCELAALADDQLVKAGYARVGFDHYAKPDNSLVKASIEGRLKRNFQGFTDDAASALIGFGASAISYIDGLYAQNEKNVGEYIKRVHSGAMPIVSGLHRTKRENVIAEAIGDLLCKMETNVSMVLRGAAPEDAVRICSALEALEADGVISWRGDIVAIAPGAHHLARVVAMAIDPYMQHQAEYAAAV